MDSLRGRVALVTGAGRRRGIGTAICRALAEKGAGVFFTYWSAYDGEMSPEDRDRPEALLQELRGAGVRAESMELDLSLSDSPERLLDAATERLGPLSILVNNAAYSTHDGFEELDAVTLDLHYAVNLGLPLS